jgi:hypothetical protein
MKKGVIALLAVMLLGLSACSSTTPPKVVGGVPEFVRQWYLNAPEDTLIGVGTAKLASVSQSKTVAETRARAEISRQMQSIVKDMVRDYQAASEVDLSAALAFQETITVALSKSTLVGSRIVDFNSDEKGAVWVYVSLGKSDVVQEINQAAAAAKLRTPALASFDAEARMNQAFKDVEPEVGDR